MALAPPFIVPFNVELPVHKIPKEPATPLPPVAIPVNVKEPVAVILIAAPPLGLPAPAFAFPTKLTVPDEFKPCGAPPPPIGAKAFPVTFKTDPTLEKVTANIAKPVPPYILPIIFTVIPTDDDKQVVVPA